MMRWEAEKGNSDFDDMIRWEIFSIHTPGTHYTNKIEDKPLDIESRYVLIVWNDGIYNFGVCFLDVTTL